MQAIASGELDGLLDILAPGGGWSLLSVTAAAALIAAGMINWVIWVMPRDSLRLQAEDAFVDPGWRAALGHALRLRFADNDHNPFRALTGYVITRRCQQSAGGPRRRIVHKSPPVLRSPPRRLMGHDVRVERADPQKLSAIRFGRVKLAA